MTLTKKNQREGTLFPSELNHGPIYISLNNYAIVYGVRRYSVIKIMVQTSAPSRRCYFLIMAVYNTRS